MNENWADLRGRPAEKLTRGTLWQRPEGVFPDDPDVEEPYAQLCRIGDFAFEDLDWTPVARAQQNGRRLARALIRRAAEDGYRAVMRYVILRPRKGGYQVKLVGPLTAELAADPVPGWRAEAAGLYSRLRQGEKIYLTIGYWNESPLAPTSSTSEGAFLERELRALAAREGVELDFDMWEFDGMVCVIKLLASGERPTGRM